MWPFRRRRPGKGRHAAGAPPAAAREAATPGPPGVALAPSPVTPRVQLGFRDGSSAALDPMSAQSLALEQLAKALTARD